MQVQFYLDSGANIHSNNKSGWLDTKDDLGLDEGEWELMDDNTKYAMAVDWANNYLEIGYEEKQD